MRKIQDYAEYFGLSLIEAYFALVDMGEIKESDMLRKQCERV